MRQIESQPKEPQPERIPATTHEGPLDQEVKIVQPGAKEMRFGTGKKLGKDGCGY